MIRAILVDDDQSNLQTLKLCLADFSNSVEIIGSFASSSKALAEIKRLNPDILFLDIDMPVINGLALAKETIGHYGELIFVTAHEKYWKEAFNIHAFQFLLKPINEEKLSDLIDDLKEREKNGWLGLWQQRIEDMEILTANEKFHAGYIWLPDSNNGLTKVYWKEIALFEKPKTGKNEVYVYSKDNKVYCKKNATLAIIEIEMTKLELPLREKFWRINDQQVLNMEFVSSYLPNNRLLALNEAVCCIKPEYELIITRPEAVERISKNKLRGRG